MRVGAVICFVLAGVSTFAAISNVIGGVDRPGGVASNIGYTVGLFILPVVFLVGGIAARAKGNKTVDRQGE